MRTGQQGVMIYNDDIRIGIDLFLSDEDGRLLENVVNVEDLSDIDILFGTHDHLDHIDREMWKEAAKLHEKLVFCAPKFFEKTLPGELGIDAKRFIFVDEGTDAEYKGIRIEALPAAHEFLDESPEGLHPYLMYVLTIDGRKICHMGDTCLYEGALQKLRSFGRFDVMFLPINGRDAKRYSSDCIGNMTFQEAADTAGILRPILAVPGHYDMFAHNSENPREFLDYVKVKYPGQDVRICEVGEVIDI